MLADGASLPRSDWPTFIVRTQTMYEVSAPSIERLLQWFSDWSDLELDCVTIGYGSVKILGQVDPEATRADVRWPKKGRLARALDALRGIP